MSKGIEVIYNWRALTIVGIVALLVLLPMVIKLDYVMDVMFLVFLYILLGQSFNIMGGYTGLVSLGHSAFFGTGALAMRFFWAHQGLPFYISIIAGGATAALVSLIIGIPCLRLRGAYFAMGTLALTIIASIIVSNIFITQSFLPPAYLANHSTLLCYYVSLAFAIAEMAAVFIITNSKLGMGMIAVREDEEAARSVGVYVFQCKLKALLVSSFFGGIAGGVFAHYQVALYYHYGFSPMWSFEPIIVTFIGGPGTLFGPVFGAVFYVVLREIFALTMGAPHIVLFGIIFILVILLLPQGLAGVWETVRKSISQRRQKQAMKEEEA